MTEGASGAYTPPQIDMGREIEILSVASPSHGSVEEDTGPTLPLHTEPQGLIGSGHYCPRT